MSLFILSIIFSYIFRKALEMFPQSKLLNYIDFIFSQLKWGWSVFLFQSFSRSCNFTISEVGVFYHGHVHDDNNELRVTHFERDNLDSSVECAICLCNIEDGEQVRELNCDHLFHRACLDRWMNCGRMTCPLCRNHLVKPNTTFSELHHQEVIHLDLFSGRSRDRCEWWLR
ncbi:hypothetical protein HAX54_011534 [Datura stramonium]|uniref:RING-type domain-containing protein n=1 Tax=Datura stramonium TaxID=4076 RepID=A0ABS8Y518_DATST|nr:hypothetical protein [Datura stramonium]